MVPFRAQDILILLSFAAGALHMLAPDHCVPPSFFAWKRRWSGGRALVFVATASVAHVALGSGLYFVLRRSFPAASTASLFSYALALMLAGTLLRGLRASRLTAIFRIDLRRGSGLPGVLKFMGPAESVVPVLVAARALGLPYAQALSAFLVGTLVAGAVSVICGVWFWNRPRMLIRGFDWALSPRLAFPLGAGLCLAVSGLGLLLR